VSQTLDAACVTNRPFQPFGAEDDFQVSECPFVGSCLGEAKRAGGGVGHSVPAGGTIFSERDEASSVVRLDDGLVRCFRVTADGRRLVSRFVWAGNYLSGGSGIERSYGAEAIGPCQLTVFPRSQSRSAVLRDMRLRQVLLSAMEAELDQILRAQMRVTRLAADEALADFLVEITQNQRFGDVFDIAMTRRDIADHLGVTLETISRLLNGFHRDGLIVLHGVHRFSVPRGSTLFSLSSADRDCPQAPRRYSSDFGSARPLA